MPETCSSAIRRLPGSPALGPLPRPHCAMYGPSINVGASGDPAMPSSAATSSESTRAKRLAWRKGRRHGVTTEPSHLTASAAELLSESNANRIRAIRGERRVHYSRARHVLQILSRLRDHPRTTRMPSIAIYGDSGMGKTMIMEKFRRGSLRLF